VPIGAGLFIVALTVSAAYVPALRTLHFFQALIYVAVIVLAHRHRAWAFGAGVAVPLVWNSLQLFVTHLMQTGAVLIWSFIRTGEIRRPDTMMVAIGWLGHSVLIVSCIAGFLTDTSGQRAWGRFAAGALLSLAYFALIVATLLPR
jgi:hypothetical protein